MKAITETGILEVRPEIGFFAMNREEVPNSLIPTGMVVNCLEFKAPCMIPLKTLEDPKVTINEQPVESTENGPEKEGDDNSEPDTPLIIDIEQEFCSCIDAQRGEGWKRYINASRDDDHESPDCEQPRDNQGRHDVNQVVRGKELPGTDFNEQAQSHKNQEYIGFIAPCQFSYCCFQCCTHNRILPTSYKTESFAHLPYPPQGQPQCDLISSPGYGNSFPVPQASHH